MTRFVGFPPFFREDSRILILGSFPSVKSREVNFYYGNKQNRFWRMLSEILNEPLPESLEDKKALLSRRKIALWDVVTECEIVGSMDSDVKNPAIADVDKLIVNSRIERILANGALSYTLLTKNFPHLSDIAFRMPSTSPANARFDISVWRDALSPLLY